jgi:hypothetical protein
MSERPAGPRSVLVTLLDLEEAGEEDAYNRWFNEEHVRARMQCRGFVSVTRFRALEGRPDYLAIWELASPEALETPEYRDARSREARSSAADHPRARSIVRTVYTEISTAIGTRPTL